MIEYKFILNPDSDNLEIEEPIGFSEVELSIIRDEKLHGIGFEASTSSLSFYGDAFDYLKTQKTTYGLKSVVVFQALSRCEGEEEYKELIKGRLNFSKYKETCGDECKISMPIEQDGCQFTFKNRYDQKVDVESIKSFNGTTTLPNYAGINFEMDLPAKAILAINEATTDTALSEVLSDQPDWFLTQVPDRILAYILPGFQNVKNSSLGLFQTASYPTMYNGGFNNYPSMYAVMPATVNSIELLGDIKCDFSNPTVSFRLKGNIVQVLSGGTAASSFTLKIFRLPVGADPSVVGNWVQEYSELFASVVDDDNVDYDIEDSVTLSDLQQGDIIYFAIWTIIDHFSDIESLTFNQTTDCYLKIQAESLCESSTANVSLVHELLSKVAEYITDYCIRVKSSYYGRFDSEPFSFDNDGCGGLRVLTGGLKIRKAVNEKFFISFKELIEGLNNIDNIGMDIVDDPDRPGKFLIRIEDLDFFYDDNELLRLDFIPDSSLEVEEARYYAKILIGYKKWEVEKINGLDEINSNREYHTSLAAVANEIDLQSGLVAGSYAIESTRQQSFAESGGADTKYDNESFIICVKRSEYPYGDVEVEQGNVINEANIYSPDTLYNYRISPLRNLMRWYKSLVSSYANFYDTDNKLFFGSGTGNIAAQGEMEASDCKIEKTSAGYGEGVINESQNLFITHFANPDDYKPLWKNESIPFEYPLSIDQYNKIKSKPYGFISYQCGTGDYEKGWIKEIKFKPVKGTATFILRKKWQ